MCCAGECEGPGRSIGRGPVVLAVAIGIFLARPVKTLL